MSCELLSHGCLYLIIQIWVPMFFLQRPSFPTQYMITTATYSHITLFKSSLPLVFLTFVCYLFLSSFCLLPSILESNSMRAGTLHILLTIMVRHTVDEQKIFMKLILFLDLLLYNKATISFLDEIPWGCSSSHCQLLSLNIPRFPSCLTDFWAWYVPISTSL